MIYSLWTIINIGLFIIFITICFQATKLLREKFGLIVSIIFAFGLLSSFGSINKQNVQGKKWTFKSQEEIEPNTSNYLYINIENNWLSTIDLGVVYGKEKSSDTIVAIEANSTTSGLLGGHFWNPEIISINNSSNRNRLNYTVRGLLEWKFLGATIYSQNKYFVGAVDIK